MLTLQYVYSNICAKTLVFLFVLVALFGILVDKYLDSMLYLCSIILIQIIHFAELADDTKCTIEHVLIKGVIDKRPFKYEEGSVFYGRIWQEIIDDINLLVRAKYNNKYYHFGNKEVAKDRFFGIINKFSHSLDSKKETPVQDFTYWEKTLLIVKNIYEEDSNNQKIVDEKCNNLS